MKGFTNNVLMVNATRFRNRVNTVLGFSPDVRIVTPPPLSLEGECVPPPLSAGGEHTR
jgi:hypothetical protein